MSVYIPAYLETARRGELDGRIEWAQTQMRECSLCPWECRVNRLDGQRGNCRGEAQARVYAYMAHHGEEKPLSGQRGSGTIFFAGCNLSCQYCQNADISQNNRGILVEDQRLAEMMLELQDQGCHNINLVTPTHVVPQILAALKLAIPMGLRLPLVYNTGGYDKVDTLRMLSGIIDIYLPDLKYADAEIACKYSGAVDYPIFNQLAVREMHNQVGVLQLDEMGLAEHGLLVRHLLLPDGIGGTQKLLHFLAAEISPNTYTNIMDQYKPDFRANEYPELMRMISRAELRQAKEWALAAGLTNLE